MKNKKKSDPQKPKRPWRESIEGVTVAIILAVFLKYFIVEAYKIPSGSMQPTLMGSPATQIFDRILVDKLSFHFREPERFEVVVFGHPLQRSMNMIKRIVGMPNEELKVEFGDLWTRPLGSAEEWTILRRTDNVQEGMWKEVLTGSWGSLEGGNAWRIYPDRIVAQGEGGVVFPGGSGGSLSVKNHWLDGYAPKIAAALATLPARERPGQSSQFNVGDLRFECTVEASAGCKSVVLELREGSRRYRFELPGPAAGPDTRARITTVGINDLEPAVSEFGSIEAGEAIEVVIQNLDDRLSFEVDGDVIASLEIPAAANQSSQVVLLSEGSGCEFRDLQVLRDVYYIDSGVHVSRWEIGEDEYVVLGDNTLDSADARDWRAFGVEVSEDGELTTYRGNARQGENPIRVTREDGGTHYFIKDEFGERHVFDGDEIREIPPAFSRGIEGIRVPRSLVKGRAVAVFWPVSLKWGVARMKWIR